MILRLFRYAFTQSKTRAMKSRLLDGNDWHCLLRMRNLEDVFRYLSATDYGPFLSGLSPTGSDARAISLSLHDSLFKNAVRLSKSLTQNRAQVVYRLLARYEAENIKTLLRGIWQAMPETTIRPLLYRLETLSRLPIDALLKTRQIPDAIDLLQKTDFHASLVHALAQFRTQNRLFPLEIAVDLAAFRLLTDQIKTLRGIDRKQTARLIGLFVDGVNLSWLIRFRQIYGLSPEEIINYSLPEGCHITLRDIGALARAADLPLFLSTLPQPYRNALGHVQHWSRIQPVFQTWLVAGLYRVFYKDPFHLGLPVSCILLKEMEVKALDGLISAVGAGMPFERISQVWQGGWMQAHDNHYSRKAA